jgi:hypothetical protein
MNLIDLTFAKIYYTFRKFGEDDIPFFYATGWLSIILSFDLMAGLLLVDSFLFRIDVLQNRYSILIIVIMIFLAASIYYFITNRAHRIILKYKHFSNRQNVLVYSFLIASLIFVIVVFNLKRNDLI